MKIFSLALVTSLVASTSALPSQDAASAHKLGHYKPKHPHKWHPAPPNPWSPWTWPWWKKPLVSPEALAWQIKIKDLVNGEKQLQSFSDSYWQNNRVFGGPAHMDTVNYLYDEVAALGYFDVYMQEQVHLWSDSNQTLSVNGISYEVSSATYGPNGHPVAQVVGVADLGCTAANYPAGVAGKIALISRGVCPFGDKVALAGSAGAVGAIIYNNVPGTLAGTLGAPSNPLGPYVPVVFVTQDEGATFVNGLTSGLTADLLVNAVQENRTTYNVIAQTKGGNQNDVVVLGAHTDSVNAGPGINDDGSGSIGLLTVAKALSKFSIKNAVRFCWWTAEEYGLLGSEYYVDQLSEQEVDKIALYLNFDMIASPNFIYGIYDGDGSAFNISGPTGSAEIEKLFEKYYADRGLNSVPTEFNGRSDYGPFLDVGIPSGGLFTGAEETKTEEEAALFGGEAGVALDACYHAACDDINNLALDAFEINAKAIAYSIGTYARSLETIPLNTTAKRDAEDRGMKRRSAVRRVVHAPNVVRTCAHEQTIEEI